MKTSGERRQLTGIWVNATVEFPKIHYMQLALLTDMSRANTTAVSPKTYCVFCLFVITNNQEWLTAVSKKSALSHYYTLLRKHCLPKAFTFAIFHNVDTIFGQPGSESLPSCLNGGISVHTIVNGGSFPTSKETSGANWSQWCMIKSFCENAPLDLRKFMLSFTLLRSISKACIFALGKKVDHIATTDPLRIQFRPLLAQKHCPRA